MDYVGIFQENVLPVYINALSALTGYVSQFFETTIGSVLLIFGCLYLIRIGLKVFYHIQNERFCRSLGL